LRTFRSGPLRRWFAGDESISSISLHGRREEHPRKELVAPGIRHGALEKGEMNYSAISDITVEKLEQFRDLYEM
jgi:hypothetical protein